jgi:hypothetical protein
LSFAEFSRGEYKTGLIVRSARGLTACRTLPAQVAQLMHFFAHRRPPDFNEELAMPGRQVEDQKARKNEQERTTHSAHPQEKHSSAQEKHSGAQEKHSGGEKHNGSKEDGKTQRGGQENKGHQNR